MIIQEEQTTLNTPAGEMRTYVYRPVAAGTYPGLILFSEIFQQTGPIKRTAMLFAGHGFVVAVPEIFHELELPGCVLAYDQAGADRGNYDKTAKTVQSYDDDARITLDYLKKHSACNGFLGCLGICIGGHLSFRAAMNAEVKAAVCFYATDIHKRSLGLGMKDNSLDRIPEIHGELLMVWGKQDPHVPAEGRSIIYQALTAADTAFTWHEFNGQHAFLRDEGARYDPALALTCYTLAIDLFRRKLTSGDLTLSPTPAKAAESRH